MSIEVYKEALCAAIDGKNEKLLAQVTEEILSLQKGRIKQLWKETENSLNFEQIKWFHKQLAGSTLDFITELSEEEQKLKAIAESNIRDTLKSFVSKGENLKLIRDNKLYRNSCLTFETYCSQVLAIAESTASRYIQSADVVNTLQAELGNKYLPENYYIASEVSKVKLVSVVDFWQTVIAESERLQKTITKDFVSKVHEQLKLDALNAEPLENGTYLKVNASKKFKTWGVVEDFEHGRYLVHVGKPKPVIVSPGNVEKFTPLDIHHFVVELSNSDNEFISKVSQSFFLFTDYTDEQIEYIKSLPNVEF
jgi:hypothetical protein